MNTTLATVVEALGWSLLHFLWQGTAVAILLAGILMIFRNGSAQLRYLLSGLAFISMLGLFALTFVWHLPPSEGEGSAGTVEVSAVAPEPAALRTSVDEPRSIVGEREVLTRESKVK